jgi:hypothetical protein
MGGGRGKAEEDKGVDMREWLKRDWEGVVEPSEVEGWL